MNSQSSQSKAAYFGLINGLARFLSRENEHGYVFATADYQPLALEIKRKLADQLSSGGKKLLFLRLEKDPDRSIRKQIEEAVAKEQPDALLIQGIDELLPRDVSNAALSSEGASIIDELNYAREALNAMGLPIVFWLSRRNLSLLGNRAADLFAQRRRSVFFFTYHPELEVDTPLMQSRFQKEFRDSEDYKRLKLQVNLLEAQLDETQQKKYPARRIAKDIALPLAQKYSELDLHERANELIEQYEGDLEDKNPKVLKQLAAITYKAGKYERSEQYLQSALKQLPADDRSAFKAGLFFDLGETYADTGQLEKAVWAFQHNHDMLDALIADGYDGKYDLAVSYSKLGDIYQALGKFDEALDFFLKETNLFEELHRANPQNESLKNGLTISYAKLGDIYQALGKFDEALDFFLKDLKLTEELHRANPQSVELENGLAISYYKLAELHRAKEEMVQARTHYDKAIAVWEKLYERTQWGQIGEYLKTVRERSQNN